MVFYYTLTHSVFSIVLIALPGMALFGVSALAPGLPHPYLMPAVYTALVLGGVGGGFLVAQYRERKQLAFLALPVVAYAVAAVFTNPVMALLVLIPVVISFLLGGGMRRCLPQTPVLVAVAAALAAFGVLAYLIWYYLFARVAFPAPGPFTYLGTLVRDGIARVLRDSVALYKEAGITVSGSEIDFRNAGAVIGNTLIGFFLSGCGVLAFVIFRVWLRVLTGWGTLSRVPLRVGAMTVSPVAAALFLLSSFGSSVAAGSMFGTVCDNLTLILEPALVLVGVTALLGREGKNRSKLSTLWLLLVLVLLFNFPSLSLMVIAVVGAVRILWAAWALRKKDNK